MQEAASIAQRWVGEPVPRKEDEALLTGRARFIDDLSPGSRHSLRGDPALAAPACAHRSHRCARVPALRGVLDVVTGSDLAALIGPVPSVVKAPIAYLPDRDRPHALCRRAGCGGGRRDALYRGGRLRPDRRRLRGAAGGCRPRRRAIAPARRSSTKRPARTSSAGAASATAIRMRPSPRPIACSSSRIPIRATPRRRWRPSASSRISSAAPDRYTVWSNFQGPFVAPAADGRRAARAGHRLRLITPPSSGGSFGIKQAVLPTSSCSRR